MIDKILAWDKEWLLNLNFDGGILMDNLMWCFSSKITTICVIILFLFLMKKYRGYNTRDIVMLVIFMAIIVLIADQTSQFFKHNMPKFRPTHNPELQGLIHTVKGYVGGLYGTVSGHAANTLGLCMFMSLVYKNRWFTLCVMIYVLLVEYSRIYLGVHFPLDLIFGSMFGLLYGWAIYWLYKHFYLQKRKKQIN